MPVDTSIYALPESDKCTFKGAMKDKAAAAAITVSADPTAEDEVAWAAGACVATLENRKFKRVYPEDGARKWQQDNLEISLIKAKATKEHPPKYPGFTQDPPTRHKGEFFPLSKAVINLADFVSTSEPAAECVRQVTYTSHPPLLVYSLTVQVKTTPSKRPPAARAPKSPEQIASAASSSLGNAQSGKELLFKVDSNCSFRVGACIGIAVEDAWRVKLVMLLHTRSKFEHCAPHAPNFFGRVTAFKVEGSHADMLVKCPEVAFPEVKNGKSCPESEYGWRLLPACSSALKQSIDLQSEPYASFDLQNEPIFCIFPSSDAAEADDKVAQQEAKDVKAAADCRAKQVAYDRMQEIKKQAILLSQTAFEMSSEEMGMVRLRRGFLACQPYISAVLKLLMGREDWYGSACGDACIRFFGSRNGPWDVFSMFNFLLRSKTPNYLDSKDIFGMVAATIGPAGDVAATDNFRERLRVLFNDIFCVRNWWAHLGAGSLDCNKALKAVKDFVQIVADSALLDSSSGSSADPAPSAPAPQHAAASNPSASLPSRTGAASSSAPSPSEPLALLANPDDMLAGASSHLTLDDVAYVLFLRAGLQLCKFCTEIYGTLRCSSFSKAMGAKLDNKKSKTSRRQSEVIEVSDVSTVLRKLFQSNTDFSFYCRIITATRNRLSHASEGSNQIILVMMALGAIGRVSSFIVEQCWAF
jgi:hypothetical protein